jgi:hypothetical protein
MKGCGRQERLSGKSKSVATVKLLGLYFLIILGVVSCQAGPSWSEQDAIDVVRHELNEAITTCQKLDSGSWCSAHRHSLFAVFGGVNYFHPSERLGGIKNGSWSATFSESSKWEVIGHIPSSRGRSTYMFEVSEITRIVTVIK